MRHQSLVNAEDRMARGRTLWFTGLSGSGKSSVAMLVEQKLLEKGVPAYVLDGDNLRHGLNADLGFSMADRAENLRRLAHVAALLADSGHTVLVPAISPLAEHRELARRVHADAGLDFAEVFCDTPLEDCERRDPKGLYAKARAGEITHFTGIDSPYQRPKNPDLRLTPDRSLDELAQQVVDLIESSDVERPQRARRRHGWPPKPAELLLAVREELADATEAERKAAGDKRSHDFLMDALARERPGDAVLSEEGADDPVRLSAERVWIVDPLDGTREFSELGRQDWAVHVALWQSGDLVAGAVALPAQGVTLATPDRRTAAGIRGRAPDRGLAHPPAGDRAAGPRPLERHAGGDGIGGRQGRRGHSGIGRCVRPRRRTVRVGFGGAGRGGPRRRFAHLAYRRVAAGVQPARPAAARPGGVPSRIRRRGAGRHRLSWLGRWQDPVHADVGEGGVRGTGDGPAGHPR